MELDKWTYWNKEEIIIKEKLIELYNGNFYTSEIYIGNGKGQTIKDEYIKEGIIEMIELNEQLELIRYFGGDIKIRNLK